MGAKKRASNSHGGGEKKAKKSVDRTAQAEDGGETEAKSNFGIEILRNDPSRLGVMTVRELIAVSKEAGIHAKGRKKDLISALDIFLRGQEKESVPIEDNGTSRTAEAKTAKATLSKGKSKDPSVEDSTQVPDQVTYVSGTRTESRSRTPIQQSEYCEEKPLTFTRKAKHHKSAKTEVQGSRKTLEVSSKTSTHAIYPAVLSDEPWTVLAHKKPQAGWVAYNPKTMRPPPLPDSTEFVKLLSWNVNGLRALMKSGGFPSLEIVKRENFDVLCLQETKMQDKDVEDIKCRLTDGYEHSFWACSVLKLGYSGTAVISRIKPISVRYGLGIEDHDGEGRLVTVEFDTFYLLNGYVPNSGEGLKRLTYRVTEWDTSLSNYMKELEKSKPVILTGDLNCAHEEIDIYNPAGNRRSAGFTDEERQSFESNFLSRGFVDTYRRQHPDAVGYTYWGYRHGGRKTNKGWRLDYFLVSESVADDVHDSYIMPDVLGSDHCPVGLVLKV